MLLGQGVLAFQEKNKTKKPGQAHRYRLRRALVSSAGMRFSSRGFSIGVASEDIGSG